MSDLKLPDTFDVVVCGTGLTESMVAASLSRIGKKVLHIDRHEYYGSHWATFTFESLGKWIQSYQTPEVSVGSGDAVPPKDVSVKNICVRSYIPEKPDEHPGNPEKTSENPANTTENPANTTENPELDTENPANATENPDLDTGNTGNTTENPELDTENPELDTENPENSTPIFQSESNDVQTSNEDKEMSVDIVPSEQNVETSDDFTVEQSGTNHVTSEENNTQSKQVIKDNNNDIVNSNPFDAGKTESVKPGKPLSMISQARIKQNSHDISLEDFIILSRKFNLDITTKFLFSAGPLVNTIIKANISHYAEFKVVNRIMTWKEDQLTEVPCNRADVFGSTFLTMIEKRMLMKFLSFCLESPSHDSEEVISFIGKPFTEFLDSRKLSANLKKFIIYSIALVKPDTHTEVALSATHKFLKSLGRYGKAPFIWPLYGIGELPQAFCRMSAVFGGTYCLSVSVDSISTLVNHINRENDKNVENNTSENYAKVKNDTTEYNSTDENSATVKNNNFQISINGQQIQTEYIVSESSYVPYRYEAKSNGKMISRGILITNQSLLPTADEHLSFLTIPPLLGHEEAVRVIEVGPASSACPSGLFVLYLTCASSFNTAEEDLLQYTTLLVARSGEEEDANKPKLLWSVYYNLIDDVVFEGVPDNFFIPSLPDSSLCFDKAVEEAKKIFEEICPGEEFMLAVPNAEDIIWGDGSEGVKEDDNHSNNDNNGNTTEGDNHGNIMADDNSDNITEVEIEDGGSKEKDSRDIENRVEDNDRPVNKILNESINNCDEDNKSDNIVAPTNSNQHTITDELAGNTKTDIVT